MRTKGTTSVQAVDRALTIIELLKNNTHGLGVTELANRLDVAKSTVHRLLTSLRNKGYVQQNAVTEKYELGLKLLELGNIVSESLNVQKVANLYLNQLAKETGETVHLVILDGNEVVYIDKIESSATIIMKSNVGKRAPAYCTGVGKAILSLLPTENVLKIINSSKLYQYTRNTITNKEDLIEELRLTRER